MKKISVLICVYDGEKYVDKCLTSIINQDYNNYEIVVIDDGSTDNTYEKLSSYLNKIKYYKNVANVGLAASRNIAISHATGDYLLFVDIDDYLEPNLLNNISKNLIDDPDIIRYQAKLNMNRKEKKYISKKFDNLNGVNAVKFFINQNVRFGPVWLYCYNANFLKTNFKFPEGRLHEDFYNNYILLSAKKIKSIDYIGYNYIKNSDNITSKKGRDEELNRIRDMLFMYDYTVDKIFKLGISNTDLKIIILDLIGFLENGYKYLDEEEDIDYLKKEIENKRRRILSYGNK